MTRHPPALSFIALLCVSVLFVRVGGMHLHMCLDGQEEPTEVHWADNGVHADVEHTGSAHEDRDVDLSEGLAKTAKSFGDFSLALLATLLVIALLPAVRQVALRPIRIAAPRSSRGFRPPLRGPPHPASLTF